LRTIWSGVSWRIKPPRDRTIRRAWPADLIIQIHSESRRTYGWRRVRAELADAYAQAVNKKLIQATMAEQGISGLPIRRRGKPKLLYRLTAEDLVNRDFQRHGPNQLWMTDVTDHPTREGRLYCCVVLDAFSRRVVGWSLDRRPTAAMVNAALGMAIESRKPAAGTLVHSDHGSQYTSWLFSQRVRRFGHRHRLPRRAGPLLPVAPPQSPGGRVVLPPAPGPRRGSNEAGHRTQGLAALGLLRRRVGGPVKGGRPRMSCSG
jgi:transposase InsO family protein